MILILFVRLVAERLLLLDNGTGVLGNDLGQEIDLTLVHKYDANTKIVSGYSHYFTTVSHSLLNGSGAGDNTITK